MEKQEHAVWRVVQRYRCCKTMCEVSILVLHTYINICMEILDTDIDIDRYRYRCISLYIHIN